VVGVDGITVWMVEVDTVPVALWPRLNGLLIEAERTRAARFVFEQHQRQYQSAHALKRLMLSAASGGVVRPESWAFETEARGKPRIADRTGPQFNLSHTDGLVACAVSWQVELGVDVESLGRSAPMELATWCFTPAEEDWLRGLPAASQPTGFFKLWTLKEAYIKATGLGLAQPLDAFSFSFDPLQVTFSDPALGHPAVWHFHQHVSASHVLTLAWRSDAAAVVPVELTVVRFEALLGDESDRNDTVEKTAN
jgi:4'-phosphopantetheinyl transferase